MKKSFPGYYQPTPDEFAQLWKDCFFAFDANVLLNLYRYTPETKDSFIRILQNNPKRIWLPYQAALEYHKERINVIQRQMNAYDDILNIIEKEHDIITKNLNGFAKHRSIKISGITEILNKSLKKIKNLLEKLKKDHPNFINEDPIQETIAKLFDGKVGNATSKKDLSTICKQGEDRYRLKVPPGHEDKQKDGNNRYGDLIIWFQLMDEVKKRNHPLIFVTDDRKEDWWLKIEGKIICPQPELVQEMATETKRMFYMYPPEPFMNYANKYLKQNIEKKAIDEVREVSQGDEALQQTNATDRLMRALMGTSGSSGSLIDEALQQTNAKDRLMRALMGTSGSAGSLIDEALQQTNAKDRLMRALMGTTGSSGSLIDKVLQQTNAKDRLMNELMGTSGSSETLMNELFLRTNEKDRLMRELMETSGTSIIEKDSPNKEKKDK